MGKNLFITDFKKLPGGFLLALSLIFAFEIANIYFDDYFLTLPSTETNLDFKIENMISQNPEYRFDILILGDCYARVGIIPRIIEEKTGLSCYNFSTHSEHTVLIFYCILKNYLETHPEKPKYLIISFDHRTYRMNEPEPGYLYDFAKGNIKVFIEEFGILHAARFFIPSLNHQAVLKKIIKNPSLLVKAPIKRSIDTYIKQAYLARGHSEWKADEVYTGNAMDRGRKKEYDYSVSEFSLKYLKRILGLAEQNNIKIIYLMTANPLDLYKIFKKYGHIDRRANFVNSLEKQYPDLIVFDPQDMLNEKEMYSTKYHLNKKGQELLSESLALEINQLESAGDAR